MARLRTATSGCVSTRSSDTVRSSVEAPIVVKLGTSLVVGPEGRLRRSVLRERAREIAELVRAGDPVCVVSSGAIALELQCLGLARRPRSIPWLQAASALGQARLQAAWDNALGREEIPAAQILLTADKSPIARPT